jgi:hypothetical protein
MKANAEHAWNTNLNQDAKGALCVYFGIYIAPHSELPMLLHQLKCIRAQWIKVSICKEPFLPCDSSSEFAGNLSVVLKLQRVQQVLPAVKKHVRNVLWRFRLVTCKSMVERRLDLCGCYDRN